MQIFIIFNNIAFSIICNPICLNLFIVQFRKLMKALFIVFILILRCIIGLQTASANDKICHHI